MSAAPSPPLDGRRVVVTRAAHQAPELVHLLRSAGADPITLPVVTIEDPSDGGVGLRGAFAKLDEYQWLIVTSINTVVRIAPLIDRTVIGGTVPSGVKVAAIGAGTAGALREAGVQVDLLPTEFVAESLVEQFPVGTGRVLLPHAAAARDIVPRSLVGKGWSVDVVEAYRTSPRPLSPSELRLSASADAITFTASSTVTAFLQQAGLGGVPPVVACIGPITASTARDAGLQVAVVAEEHTMSGLVEALSRVF